MKEEILKNIFKDMPVAYALHQFVKDEENNPCDYIFMDVNPKFEEYTGLCASDILGKKVTEILPEILDDDFDWIRNYSEVAYDGKKIELEQYSETLDRWYKLMAYSPQEGFFVTLFEDISENKKMEKQILAMHQITKRQEIIIDIYKQEALNQQEFLHHTLNRALEMTDSQFGYIYTYDENKCEFQLNSWTEGVMPECRVADTQTVYRLDNTGLWGEVVRQRKSIIVNDYKAENPLKKVCPEGHVQLSNYMSIPVMHDGKIVAVVGLANKETGYSEFDINQLTLLMQSAWLIKEAKLNSLKQKDERQKYNDILNSIPVLLCEFKKDSTLTFVNDRYCEYFGRQRKNLIGKPFLSLVSEERTEDVKGSYLGLTPENPTYTHIYSIQKDNQLRWMEWKNIANFDKENMPINYYSIGSDITERIKLAEQEKSELARLRSMVENHSAVMLFIEPKTGAILDANPAASKFYGYTNEELLKMYIQDINMLPKERLAEASYKAENKLQEYFTFPHLLKSGEVKMVDVYSSPIDFEQKQVLLSIIFDVSDKEEAMKEIKRLAYNDYLTGAYNRRYLEETFTKLNAKNDNHLAIIMGDINGLKIVNDNFGHSAGDELIKEVVKGIKAIISSNDILARIGGDEFVILLTEESELDALKLSDRLENELERYIELDNHGNAEVYLSVSFGYAVQNADYQSLDELMNVAERQIYRRKYYNEKSMRSHMIKAMMSTLFQKSEREEKHSKRVSKYCQVIARAMGWSQERIDRIRVAGSLHDIGKIGIGESILNKEGKLDDSEWEIMKQHSMKSAKILEQTEEYRDIADVVLAHHERWDGKGYPKGLKGEEIPIKARVISVADAYDAMTEERTYRKPVCREDAIKELMKFSGTQFDPDIVDIFVKEILMEDEIVKRKSSGS